MDWKELQWSYCIMSFNNNISMLLDFFHNCIELPVTSLLDHWRLGLAGHFIHPCLERMNHFRHSVPSFGHFHQLILIGSLELHELFHNICMSRLSCFLAAVAQAFWWLPQAPKCLAVGER